MKCVLCDLRKAKRFCPAKNVLICAPCCGEKRILEIECSESCAYLKAGREKDYEDHLRRFNSLGAADVERNYRVLDNYPDVIAHLEYFLSCERMASRDLTDRDVAQAVEALLETYRIEDRGILYEKVSSDLRVDYLRREMKNIIEHFRNPEGDQARGIIDAKSTRLPLSGAIECLEFIQSVIRAYQQEASTDKGYVDFLARRISHPRPCRSLIMP